VASSRVNFTFKGLNKIVPHIFLHLSPPPLGFQNISVPENLATIYRVILGFVKNKVR